MTDHAIVIGIDAYDNPAWELRAAVRDAVRFARWVTEPGAGRATTDTLRLFLSPRAGTSVDLEYEEPSRQNIHAVLAAYSTADAGADAGRLWLFYAGHAIHNTGEARDAYPMLIPKEGYEPHFPDLTAVPLARHVPLMQARPPGEQFYFIDACRGIADDDDAVSSTTVLHFDLSDGRGPSKQAALLATTAGSVANEVSLHGLFSDALLQGLGGLGPRLDEDGDDWVVSLSGLSEFIERRVKEKQEDRRKQNLTLPVQVPSPSLFGFTGNEALVRFPATDVPRASLHLLVEPTHAVDVAGAALRVKSNATGMLERAEVRGPPLRDGAQWALLCRQHRVEIDADGFESWSTLVDLVEDTQKIAMLERRRVSRGTPGLEAVGPPAEDRGEDAAGPEGADEDWSGATRSPRGTPVVDGGRGRIAVRVKDPLTLVELIDDSGGSVAVVRGDMTHDLDPGPYRIRATAPGRPAVEAQAFVTSGVETVDVDSDVQLPAALVEALEAARISTVDGMSWASEAFGGPAAASMGSALAWAAWAARFPAGSDGRRLRRLGVDTIPEAAPSQAYVQVLVGDAEQPDWVDHVDVAFGATGAEQSVRLERVAGLDGLAGQWAGHVTGAGTSVVVSGPARAGQPTLKRTALPVPVVPGYVAVIIVAREAGGQIDIHRYLHPIDPAGHGHVDADGRARFSDLVRHEEVNWRALMDRRRLLKEEAESLLADERLDPLSLAILGYRLVHDGRADLLTRSSNDAPSALQRLADVAPGLPDAHALAALATGNGDAMERAAGAGVPVIADAYGAMFDAATRRAAEAGLPPPIPTRPHIQGSAWTLLDADDATPAATTRLIPVARLADSPLAAPLARPAAATCRIEAPGDLVPVTGSAFLVAPGVVATSEHVAGTDRLTVPRDGARLAPGWTADFGAGRRRGLDRILTRAGSGPSIGQPWGILRVTFVVLADTSGVDRVDIGWSRPKVGTRIAVIGHSYADPRIPRTAVEAAFGSLPQGDKVVVPGAVVDVRDDMIRYEAFTTNGMSGGAVVELDTGRVIGLHYGGLFRAGIKYGFAVPMSYLRHDAVWDAVRGLGSG